MSFRCADAAQAGRLSSLTRRPEPAWRVDDAFSKVLLPLEHELARDSALPPRQDLLTGRRNGLE
jgi:hypothetical protein